MDKMYINCPVCGTNQGKSGSGTNTEARCRKCGSVLNYEVSSNAVRVQIMKESSKVRANRPA